jgi:TQXA domain-containing protein
MASRKLVRAGGAVLGASVALMLSAVPAGAEAASGKVDPKGYTAGHHVDVGPGYTEQKVSLIGFDLADGSRLQMYCVEIDTPIDEKHRMIEQPWDKFPNADSPFHANRDKINWVLHNGYPVVGTDALGKTLTEQGATLKNGIDEKEAIAATQAAVWHFSDNTALNREKPLPKGPFSSAADVLALYDYLTGDANRGLGDQPTPALAVAPAELEGEAGERIGPFTVSTTGDVEKLTTKLPEGVTVTDADGTELTAEQIENGAQLYLDVPEDAKAGNGTFELAGTASVDTGRLFVGENYAKKSTQSLIVATAEKSELVASAGARWTETTTPPSSSTTQPPSSTVETTTPQAPSTSDSPAPQGGRGSAGDVDEAAGLADTGASIFAPILIGLVLVGAGVGAIFFQRHRKRA